MLLGIETLSHPPLGNDFTTTLENPFRLLAIVRRCLAVATHYWEPNLNHFPVHHLRTHAKRRFTARFFPFGPCNRLSKLDACILVQNPAPQHPQSHHPLSTHHQQVIGLRHGLSQFSGHRRCASMLRPSLSHRLDQGSSRFYPSSRELAQRQTRETVTTEMRRMANRQNPFLFIFIIAQTPEEKRSTECVLTSILSRESQSFDESHTRRWHFTNSTTPHPQLLLVSSKIWQTPCELPAIPFRLKSVKTTEEVTEQRF